MKNVSVETIVIVRLGESFCVAANYFSHKNQETLWATYEEVMEMFAERSKYEVSPELVETLLDISRTQIHKDVNDFTSYILIK